MKRALMSSANVAIEIPQYTVERKNMKIAMVNMAILETVFKPGPVLKVAISVCSSPNFNHLQHDMDRERH